ncbi:major facilitator superfamily transporter [Massariosphaeria phaeospora]|uniref:Major facilitator superfamily transporter n=1 Tax=Massariosphaeria phaeospora TaxID=100035 RepID=A0A7C8IAR6_9PLEO|nr:major facilitator superfamily transporter [Massariosphaeria phaeospora]
MQSGKEFSPDAEFSSKRLALVLGSTWIGILMASLDSSVMATLSGPIASSFDSFQQLTWLTTSYMIATAAVQPLSGRMTNIFSRRSGLLFANTVFFAGNLICGLANTSEVMILGRVVAGLGGGCLHSISTFLTSDLVPLRRRGLWQGLGNIASGVGYGIGGYYGGVIDAAIGWRWAFLIQLPLTAVSGVLVACTIRQPTASSTSEKQSNVSKLKRVDWLGAVTLTAFIVLLLTGLSSGGNIVPWNHALVYSTLSLSAISLGGFVYVEDRLAAEPILPVRLLLKRSIGTSCLTNFLSSMGYFCILFYGPLYFEVVNGLPASAAGLRLTLTAAGVLVSSIFVGWVIQATGTFSTSPANAPPFIMFYLAGAGYGSMLTVTLLALTAAADQNQHAVITSTSYAFRSTGSAIGVAIGRTVFQNLSRQGLVAAFRDRRDANELIARLAENIQAIKSLSEPLSHKALEAYTTAFKGVWGLTLGFSIASAIVSFSICEHVLHSKLSRDR